MAEIMTVTGPCLRTSSGSPGQGEYYWPYGYQTKTSRLAEDIVRELIEGIDGTDVRAGIIGEIGSRRTRISAEKERMFRAAARAHKETGDGGV